MLPDAFTLRTILSYVAVGALLCLGWALGNMAISWPASKVTGGAMVVLVVLLVALMFGL